MSTPAEPWRFRLYVSDDPESLDAESIVRRSCQKHLAGNFAVEVIHVGARGVTPSGEDILFVPSCVRVSP